MEIKKLLYDLTKSHTAAHVNFAAKNAAAVLKEFSKVEIFDNYITATVGSGEKTLMLEAHIDQVCFIVTKVYDDGFLRVSSVGAIDARALPAARVKIYGKEEISGVFTSVPPHIKKEGSAIELDGLFIDTGLTSVKDLISEGDLVFFDTEPTELKNNRFCAAGLDDKAGVTAIISAFSEIAKLNLNLTTTLVLTFGEELGLRGATVSAFKLNPDCCIAVDVSFGDFEGVPSYKTSPLGSGTMIGISPVLNRNIYTKLQSIAKENNIPFTLEVMGGKTGTDADVISISKSGIPTGLISIPLRNMHSAVEVVSLEDISATAKLITLFAKEVL